MLYILSKRLKVTITTIFITKKIFVIKKYKYNKQYKKHTWFVRKEKMNWSKGTIIYKWWEGLRDNKKNVFVPTHIENEKKW